VQQNEQDTLHLCVGVSMHVCECVHIMDVGSMRDTSRQLCEMRANYASEEISIE